MKGTACVWCADHDQVPDHQECFADGACDQSVLVELLDLQTEVNDADAAAFFFNDLVRALPHAAPTWRGEQTDSRLRRVAERRDSPCGSRGSPGDSMAGLQARAAFGRSPLGMKALSGVDQGGSDWANGPGLDPPRPPLGVPKPCETH